MATPQRESRKSWRQSLVRGELHNLSIDEKAASLLAHLLSGESAAPLSDEAAWSEEDWEAVIHLAEAQHLLPYLDWKLSTGSKAEHPPEAIVSKIHQATLHYSTYGLWLFSHLTTILLALRQAGIAVIPLKGAYLGAQVYADLYLRPMGDIDLLIQESQLIRCDEVLIHLGYHPSRKAWIEGNYRQAHHHLPPYRHSWMPPIEVHWNIARIGNSLNVPAPSLWESAHPCQIQGVPCMALSPEHLLIHLCLHAGYANRFRGGLRSLIDLWEIMTRLGEQINWPSLIEQADAWGATKCVALMFALAEKTLHLSIPQVHHIVTQIPENILQIASVRLWEREGFSANFARLWNAESLATRFKILRQRTFLPAETMAARYTFHPRSPKKYLFYLLRLFELLQRYARTFFSMHFGPPRERASAEREILLSAWLNSPQMEGINR